MIPYGIAYTALNARDITFNEQARQVWSNMSLANKREAVKKTAKKQENQRKRTLHQ